MEKKRFEIGKLEERIAPSGCQAFGALVATVAHGVTVPGLEVPDGPASGTGLEGDGPQVGNLKSGTATGESESWSRVSDRIHDSHDLAGCNA